MSYQRLPDITPYNQYKGSQPIVDFFRGIHDYIDLRYYQGMTAEDNKIKSGWQPSAAVNLEIADCDINTDWIIYLAANKYGIEPPRLSGTPSLWDIILYDSGYKWDDLAATESLTMDFFRRICLTIINQRFRRWNIPYIYELFSGLTGISPDKFHVTANGNDFAVSCDEQLGINLTSLFLYYQDLFGVPVGVSIAFLL